jgi:hypothetical protein
MKAGTSPCLQRGPFPQRALRAAALALWFLFFAAGTAQAHNRSTSYSTWEVKERRAHVTLRLAALDVSRFPWIVAAAPDFDRELGRYVAERLRLLAGEAVCSVRGAPSRLAAPPGSMVFEWNLICPEAGELRIHDDLLFDVAPSHLHFARVRLDGAPALDRVLSDADRDWAFTSSGKTGPQQAPGSSVASYVRVGIDHILSGPDHLAFVFALLLLGSSLGEVAKVVTGFTVAHSITLALTVLGYLNPNRSAIDALIGLSIAMVAAENLWLGGGRGWLLPGLIGVGLASQAGAAVLGSGCVPALTLAGLALFTVCYFGLLSRAPNPTALRWTIAFLFGLVHGFGFAGVLLEAQLSPDRLVKALFGFNAGVEIGQLAIVALIWPPLRKVAQLDGGRLHAWLVDVGSASVLAIGLFWFVTRTYG